MKGLIDNTGSRPLRRSVFAVALAGIVGCLLLGPRDEPNRETSRRNAIVGQRLATHASSRVGEQVQELLARGGCPGWIALASEPDVLAPMPRRIGRSGQAHDASSEQIEPARHAMRVYDGLIVETAFQDRGDSTPAALRQTQDETALPDDLLDGAEDLLLDRSDLLGTPAEGLPATRQEDIDDADALLSDRDDLLGAELAAPAGEAPAEDPADLKNAGELLDDHDDLLAPGIAPAPVDNATDEGAPLFVAPGAKTQSAGSAVTKKKAAPTDDPHGDLFAETLYPSAETCKTCHEKIYDEWSASSHAYAAVSPMFHKFEQTIHKLTHGTIGYFCYRCHTPAGVALCVPRDMPLWNAPQVAREGVTCVACHRIAENYGKTNGERRIEPGDIYAPVFGSIGGDGVAKAIAEKSKFKVKTSPHEKGPGQPIHTAGICFPQLNKSEFCTSCHQVAVHPGIKLEVVWEQYRASPACKKGVSCQDCHMGRIPGVASGYETGPAAVVNKKEVQPNRKHSNHSFYGPGYSIAHPGVFPWNPKAKRWTMPEWLQFDWRAGWGTEDFEDALDAGRIRAVFPKVWDDVDDRYDAREIIDDNQKKLAHKRHLRHQVFENSSHVDGPFFDTQPCRGNELKLHYVIVNTNDGHNLPTASLGAQPQFWANVALIGPRGQRLWETGYTDSHGDLADIHSEDVRHKRLPYDWQLFNLQTMFLITGAKGTDREFPLPVNVDVDQLPFIRPGVQPIPLINHPPFIRMEGRSLAPLGSRKIPYKIPAHVFQEPGRYRLAFRMRNRAEPIYFMRFCKSTPDMMRSMNEGILDVHASSVEFIVR